MVKTKKHNIIEDRDFSRSLLFPDNFFDVLPGGVVDHSAQRNICQELKSPSRALSEIWRLFPGSRFRAGVDFLREVYFDVQCLNWTWGLLWELWPKAAKSDKFEGPRSCLVNPQGLLQHSLGAHGNWQLGMETRIFYIQFLISEGSQLQRMMKGIFLRQSKHIPVTV